MKNATKHAAALKSLAKKIVKSRKGDPVRYEPLEALVRGALGKATPEEAVDAAIIAFREEYIDFNELRVATPLELSNLMGDGFTDAELRAQELISTLHEVFHKEHATNLERIGTLKAKEQRQFFKDLQHTSPYIEGYVLTFGFGTPAMPMDESIASWLESQDAIEPETELEESQRFVEAQLKGAELESFFVAAKAEALKGGVKKTAKKTTKKAKA